MRVTCPKCECKGMLDTAPLLNKAHVTCVRCGAVYEALLVEGAIETTLLSAPSEMPTAIQVGEAHVGMSEAEAVEASDEVLALPQVCAPVVSADEAAGLLDVAPLDAALPTDFKAAVEAHAQADTTPAQTAQAADPLADSGTFEMPKEYAPQFSRADLTRASDSNNYRLGVRLMRVSPLWLLACGLAFIGLIVLLNGLTGSAEQLDLAAARHDSIGNQATNQSTTNVAPADRAARAQTNATVPAVKIEHAPAEAQPVAPASAPQKVEQVAPAAQPVKAQPQASPAPVAPAPTPTARATQPEAAGKFTLQVGSFNTPVEAGERVAKLRAAGFAAQVVTVELPKRGTWYRVQTGRFADRAEAQRYGAQLRAQGAAESFIVTEITDH